MCGRFAIPKESGFIEDRFELVNEISGFEPSYNISPSETVPVITKNSPKKGVMMKWGFVPHWADFTKTKLKPINARDDKLTGSYFRVSFSKYRCLIPAGGYYEWRKFEMDGKIEKQPYYFRLKNDELFGFGGIYSEIPDAEGKKHYFFAIITTEPNSLQKPIHHRMPLIIAKKDEEAWFDSETPMKYVKPYPSNEMEVWRVPMLVNKAMADGPELIKKLPEL